MAHPDGLNNSVLPGLHSWQLLPLWKLDRMYISGTGDGTAKKSPVAQIWLVGKQVTSSWWPPATDSHQIRHGCVLCSPALLSFLKLTLDFPSEWRVRIYFPSLKASLPPARWFHREHFLKLLLDLVCEPLLKFMEKACKSVPSPSVFSLPDFTVSC